MPSDRWHWELTTQKKDPNACFVTQNVMEQRGVGNHFQGLDFERLRPSSFSLDVNRWGFRMEAVCARTSLILAKLAESLFFVNVNGWGLEQLPPEWWPRKCPG